MESTVKSSARTLDILELVAKHPQGISLTEIHRALGLPVSSVHGLLGTMVQRQYLLRDEQTALYRLGPKLLHLAASYEMDVDLVALATPPMDELRRLTHETASLTVLQHDFIVFIHKSTAQGAVQVVNPVGTVLPAHATGSGKALLADLSERELDHLYPQEELPRLTENTIVSRSGLKQALAQVRACGYAFDNQESARGVWAVAAAVRNAQGRAVAAISVVAPLFHIEGQDTTAWPGYVVQAAARTSASLGFGSF